MAEIDELQTYVGKKNKIWLWTVFNTAIAGIIAWVIGGLQAQTHLKPYGRLSSST